MGGGRGCYAGQPATFACAKCRKHPLFFERRGSRFGRRYKLTGKSRRQQSQGSNFRRWPETALQYECLDCGHVGWSRHPDVHRRENVCDDNEA